MSIDYKQSFNSLQSKTASPWKRHDKYLGDSSQSSSTTSDSDDCQSKIKVFYRNNKQAINYSLLAILLIAFIIYFVMACYLNFERATDLFIVTVVTVFLIAYYQIKGYCGDWIHQCICLPVATCVENKWKYLRW